MVGKSHADFPGGFIPFDKAVGPVPTVSISDEPTRQLCINETWLAYIIGAIKAVGRPETWDDTYDHIVYAASEVSALLGSISDGCGVIVPLKLCLSGTFADSDYGYADHGGGVCSGAYVPGTGWQSCYDAGGTREFLELERSFGSGTLIRSYSYSAAWSGPPTIASATVTFWLAGSIVHTDNFTVPAATSIVASGSPGVTADKVDVQIAFVSAGGPHFTLDDWQLCYTGTFPLSQNSWAQDLDFTVSDYGFVPYGGSGAYWTAGVGWRSTNEYIYMKAPALHDTNIGFFSVDFIVSASHVGYQGAVINIGVPPSTWVATQRDDSVAETPGGTIAITGSFPITASVDYFNVQINVNASPLGSITIARAQASGIGANPFV